MGSLLLWYNVIMGRGEVQDLHWNGGNNGDWVENDEGEICPVDDFAGELDQTYFDDANHDDIDDGIDADVADTVDTDDADCGDFHTRSRQQKEHAVAGMAMAATGASPHKPQKNSRPNSRPNRSAKRELDMSSPAYGDLADVFPPKYDLKNMPAVRSAYIAYLSSLLGETKRALDELCQSDEYLDEVAEYDRQVDEANDNCPVQPRLTRALRAEAQARRRIRALQERIDKIRQLGDKSNNQQWTNTIIPGRGSWVWTSDQSVMSRLL